MPTVIFLAGCERSGTNFIQWLLKENFKSTIIITIWKHYAPRDFISQLCWDGTPQDKKLLKKYGTNINQFLNNISFVGKGLPPFVFVSSSTKKEIPSPPKNDNKKSKIIQNIVRAAIENGTMKFLINIKNPYGWHLSYSKHWPKLKFPKHLKKWNDMYFEWMQFEQKFPDSTLFVRHEDALKDFKIELDKIKDKFAMEKAKDEYITVEKRLTTVTGTYRGKYLRKEYFEKMLYVDEIQEKYKKELEECRKGFSKALMGRFGYKIL